MASLPERVHLAPPVRAGSLPSRILGYLAREGRGYTTGIARALRVRDSAVAGAITALRARGVVMLAGEEAGLPRGRSRVYYRLTADVDVEEIPALDTPPRVAPVDLLARLGAEVALLRLEQRVADDNTPPEILECVYGNAPARGL